MTSINPFKSEISTAIIQSSIPLVATAGVSAFTILASNSGVSFTITQAGGLMVITLPAVQNGLKYRFILSVAGVAQLQFYKQFQPILNIHI